MSNEDPLVALRLGAGDHPSGPVGPDRPQRPEDIVSEVTTHELPPELASVADRYEEEIDIRDRFLWKWFHLLNPEFKLSAVDSHHEEKVQDDKTFLTFYITLIDDLLEANRDFDTFRLAAALPFQEIDADPGTEVDTAYLEVITDVWETVDERVKAAPRYKELGDVFRFDLRQVINAIRYSYVVSGRPEMASLTEAYAYGAHNMVMYPYAGIDAMHSSTFRTEELGELREVLWHAQRLARIGNWVSTWERELREHDYGSGVVIYALEHGVITAGDLHALERDPAGPAYAEIVDAIETAHIEEHFLDQWRRHYGQIASRDDLDSVDIDELLDGMETVLEFHLATRGLK